MASNTDREPSGQYKVQIPNEQLRRLLIVADGKVGSVTPIARKNQSLVQFQCTIQELWEIAYRMGRPDLSYY